jgi:hypothetical protein
MKMIKLTLFYTQISMEVFIDQFPLLRETKKIKAIQSFIQVPEEYGEIPILCVRTHNITTL